MTVPGSSGLNPNPYFTGPETGQRRENNQIAPSPAVTPAIGSSRRERPQEDKSKENSLRRLLKKPFHGKTKIYKNKKSSTNDESAHPPLQPSGPTNQRPLSYPMTPDDIGSIPPLQHHAALPSPRPLSYAMTPSGIGIPHPPQHHAALPSPRLPSYAMAPRVVVNSTAIQQQLRPGNMHPRLGPTTGRIDARPLRSMSLQSGERALPPVPPLQTDEITRYSSRPGQPLAGTSTLSPRTHPSPRSVSLSSTSLHDNQFDDGFDKEELERAMLESRAAQAFQQKKQHALDTQEMRDLVLAIRESLADTQLEDFDRMSDEERMLFALAQPAAQFRGDTRFSAPLGPYASGSSAGPSELPGRTVRAPARELPGSIPQTAHDLPGRPTQLAELDVNPPPYDFYNSGRRTNP